MLICRVGDIGVFGVLLSFNLENLLGMVVFWNNV